LRRYAPKCATLRRQQTPVVLGLSEESESSEARRSVEFRESAKSLCFIMKMKSIVARRAHLLDGAL
jgi:hypothetical protein